MSEWILKEERYEKLYASGRQAQDIWKYIPEKFMEGVDNAFSDSEGYWIWLESGWVAYDGGEDCGIIHEYTITDLKDAIRTIRKGSR